MAYTKIAVIVQQTAATAQVRRIVLLNIRGRLLVNERHNKEISRSASTGWIDLAINIYLIALIIEQLDV
jgi:hypothetical protein